MMNTFSMASFVAGTMVGVLLTGAWFFRDTADSMTLSSSLYTASSTASRVVSSGVISVVNQPSGTSVMIESVTVPPPGMWVAVREVHGNDLGNVLGAEYVTGLRNSLSITLLRATQPSQTYAVQLYRDDSAGPFDPAINSVYVDFETGERVVAYFDTTE